MTKLLELKKISKTFPGVKALSDVNIDLNTNEVLGLCGENGAGKSTLMKILTGIYKSDPGGEIWLQGKRVTVSGPREAEALGLSIIHQELNLVPDLTVAQNIFLGQKESNRHGILNDKLMFEKAAELFERLDIDINPRLYARDLTVARQQMVEIAKALNRNSRILIMDEPSAALTEAEIRTLFRMIRSYVSTETGLIYISHRMDEITEITNRVSVLRDGEYIDTVLTKDTPISKIISMMVGREVPVDARPSGKAKIGEVVMKVKNLSTSKLLKDVSFEVRKGEILGFAGLMGAGRTEAMRCVFGADPRVSGDIEIKGKKVRIKNPADAVRNGIGYLSEDRKRYGLILNQDVKSNIAVASMYKFTHAGFINEKLIKKYGERYKDELRIKTPSVHQLLRNLSGGNQQKVVIAKWLLRNCDILIFDEPTRGIDVGAKEEIYNLLERLAAEGKAIIMISSELPEVLRMSNRIAVMSNGRITGILKNEDADQEKIMHLAANENQGEKQ
ncbi:sugar ABC transporter ATP-binding protein [Mobiluncus mulieris]|uniref:sugar ABC transporter ATP-binding protein n=1 Tax=Mobiluncus mulieris TaxID=2052 RepID=UPI000D93B07D|nr:sugar ABC transporter ATP-binding protein [Mobiluncus mulieris]SPX70881.1 Ribose import ATP-binding protein RbsA [Mobiluncus mulieris]